ncbi:Coiled-coil and C2 domain-containing protein 1-like [Araneus ventricosus]|uniref:Coiled-coil and C2 domain-containing protein 1-like n=1 Tax=Araneus ventricosus TaxID=182803 RepID=A0A4Y2IRL3_ARAVE|nr:Coiled-coil and C2 domain-containing protein 1-like [Araneus ventricosus]
MKGWPSKKEVDTLCAPYWQNCYEISVQDGLLMKGCRIVTLESHQAEALNQIHEGHLGITKCRARVRCSVYWLGISKKGNWESSAKDALSKIIPSSVRQTCLQKELKHLIPSPDFHPEPEPEDDFDVTGYQQSPANADPGCLPLMSSPQSPKTYSERASSSTEASPDLYATRSADFTEKQTVFFKPLNIYETLEGLIKSAKSGAAINEEDIPPVVKIPIINTDSSANLNKPVAGLNNSGSDGIPAAGLSNSTTSNGTQHVPKAISNNSEEPHLSSSEALPTKSQLIVRRDQYKVAAVQAKRSGNKDLALSYFRTVKMFDAVIEAMNNNLPVDLSNVPPPPPEMSVVTPKASSERVAHNEVQTSSDMETAALAAANDADGPEIFAAPPPPSSVLEALQQRLEKYTATKQAADAENNSGKVRRLQRIIKQYEAAIKDYKAGKNVDFEELPTPPGFAPIPVPSVKPSVIKPAGESAEKSPKEQNKVSNTQNRSPNQPNVNTNNPAVKKPKVQRTNTSTVGEKQLDYLLERQKLFRQAALTAKQNGDIQQAKEYLRMAKGFDSMIEATKCGLPIDATTIPTPPQLESSDFVIVDVSECTPNENCSQEELHENLEKDLRHQIEMCTRNKEHFLRLGDVSSASKFEKLCLESKKDLSVIQHLKKKGEPVPRFHYETRLFSMVQCHADLGDNDLEVTVERGINLPGKPDDLDSYVRLEFPIPPESPQRAKTHTVRDTNNPRSKQVSENTTLYLNDRKANQKAVLARSVAENSLPFSLTSKLVELCQTLAKDRPALSKLKMERTAATNITGHGVAKTMREELVAKLNKNYFSMNVDEATNNNGDKIINVLFRVYDDEKEKIITAQI